ncbi:hypothetical protein Tco_1558414 [Tanacetum coccineum]
MDLCTNLQKKVLDLEKAKIAQDSEIASLNKKVKKLERRNKSRTPGLKRLRKVGSARRVESSDKASLVNQEDASKQGRKIADIDADVEVTLIDETQGRNDDNLMFDTCVLDEQEVEVEKVVSTAESATTTTVNELTLAYLIKIKAAKPKVRGVMIQELSESTTTTTTTTPAASKHSNDSLLERGNTLRSDEDSLKLDELMALCTTLQNRVFDLEKTKTTQQNEIASFKRRVKKLEKKNRSKTHKQKRLYKVGLTTRLESSDNEESLGEDASKQGRIDAIDADEEITLVSVQNVDEEMFDVNVLDGEEVFVAEQEVAVKDVNNEVNVVEEVVEVINSAKFITDAGQVSIAGNVVSTVGDATTATITTVDDITLAQALMEIKVQNPKRKGLLYKSWVNIQQQYLRNYLHKNHKTKVKGY